MSTSTPTAFDAIQSGDMGRFMINLARGSININARDDVRGTLLWAACAHADDRHGFVQDLLDKGSAVTIKGPDGTTALHALSKKRNLNISTVELVIDAGVALNEKDASGQTALHAFSQRGWMEACIAVLDASPRPSELINVTDSNGRTPLWHASENSALSCFLLSHGADPRIADFEGKSPTQMVIDPDARMLMLAQVKALMKSDAIRSQSASQGDPELDDIMNHSKAILAKGYLRQTMSFDQNKSASIESHGIQP